MNSKLIKFLSVACAALVLSAVVSSAAEEKKDGKCPCEKEKPKAFVTQEEEKKDCKKCCPCEKEKPKAFVTQEEEKKDGKCPCEKEKPKA